MVRTGRHRVRGDELYHAIRDRIGGLFVGVSLNPGHLVHLDEWVHSPIFAGSEWGGSERGFM